MIQVKNILLLLFFVSSGLIKGQNLAHQKIRQIREGKNIVFIKGTLASEIHFVDDSPVKDQMFDSLQTITVEARFDEDGVLINLPNISATFHIEGDTLSGDNYVIFVSPQAATTDKLIGINNIAINSKDNTITLIYDYSTATRRETYFQVFIIQP